MTAIKSAVGGAALIWSLILATNVLSDTVHEAARDGEMAALRAILQESPELVDARDANGRTPLHWACRGTHPELVVYLVETGADVNAVDNSGVTPLHSVAFRGNWELCRLLIDSGADVDARFAGGTASIFLAARAGHADVVELLLDSGANVNSRDGLENTPLIICASYGRLEIVNVLIEHGAEINSVNERGTTALDAAQREGHIEIAELLTSRGAKSGHRTNDSLTGDYMGQTPPGSLPVIFAPGFVSTEKDQLNAVWTADGSEFYFAQQGTQTRFVIMVSRKENKGWTNPTRLPVAGEYAAVDLFIDGTRMYFCSDRPLAGDGDPKVDYDFWYSDREGSGWGDPVHVGRVLNSDKNDFYPTLTRDGTVYFSSHRDGGTGENDIYRARWIGGSYSDPENLGEAINTEFAEFDPYVSPNETYIIFASGRPGGMGASDLYISFRDSSGVWSPAQNMGDPINSAQQDLTPMVTPDGAYLFFTSRRAGVSDLYWVDTSVISRPGLRLQE
jgi:hypothetical protein